MANKSHKKAFEDATKKMGLLIRQRDLIDRRMAKLKQFIAGLSPNEKPGEIPNSVLSGLGVKDACLDVLRANNKPLTPSEVVHALHNIFRYDMSKYVNPVAVVTTTLKRSKDVMCVTKPSGKKAYTIRTEIKD